MIEQPLPALTQTFVEVSPMGETSDFMLCAPAEDNDLVMDCFLRGIENNEFQRIQRTLSGEPLPMHYALEGNKGIQLSKDYRQEPVVAAYSPMAYGLGTVLKIDKKELHYPITKQIITILLLLTTLVIASVSTLYWLTMLLVQKLTKSVQKTRKANKELKNAREKAEQISTELATYIDAIGKLNLISVTNRSGLILQVNKKFCDVSGYSEQELLGQSHRIINSKQHPKSFFVDIWATITRGETWYGEICNRNKNGSLCWFDSAIVPIKNENQQIIRYLSVRIDITAHKQLDIALHERLKRSACIQAIRHEMELDLSLDELSQRILDHLIQAMQFPDNTIASIALSDKRFTAGRCNEKPACNLTAKIKIKQNELGQLSVFHSKNEAFLLENRTLLNTIADDLARWIERKQSEQLMIEMATHDSLTGLPNRRLLQDRIKQILAHGHRTRSYAAILFIDLDHFKNINDSLGHEIGDLLLKEVAARITSCARKVDTIARQGGDEFIAVLHTITKPSDAGIVAQKILDKLGQSYHIQNEELHIGGSIGIAVFLDDGEDAETLLKNSDIAMYHAKNYGRTITITLPQK